MYNMGLIIIALAMNSNVHSFQLCTQTVICKQLHPGLLPYSESKFKGAHVSFLANNMTVWIQFEASSMTHYRHVRGIYFLMKHIQT